MTLIGETAQLHLSTLSAPILNSTYKLLDQTDNKSAIFYIIEIKFNIQNILLLLFLFVLEFLTVFGNILVLMAIFVDFHLRSPAHYLMGSLATADLLLGMLVFPFSSIQLFFDKWFFGDKLCEFWLTTDVLCSTASIYLVLVISIDRYIGITRPLRYNSIVTKKRLYIVIFFCWTVSLIVSLAPQIGMKSLQIVNMQCQVNENTAYTLFSALFSFFIPLVIILILYYRIYKEATAQSRFMKTGTKKSKSNDGSGITLRVHIGPTNSRRDPPSCNCRDTSNINSIENSEIKKENFSSTSLDKDNSIDATKLLSHAKNENYQQVNENLYFKNQLSYKRCQFCNLRTSTNKLTPNVLKNSLISSSGLLSSKISKFKIEKKAAKTLGIVVGCFIICWFPFFISLPIRGFKLLEIPNSVCNIFFWLGYCNSAMNPLIYGLSSREFRRAYQGILKCNLKYRNKMEREKLASLNFKTNSK
ncbi:putative G- coupled receptor No9, partial [Brachionus plicatilis]